MEYKKLLQLSPQSVMITRRAIVEMMYILNPSNEPNIEAHNCKQHNVEWGLVPKLLQFSGKISDGFDFFKILK